MARQFVLRTEQVRVDKDLAIDYEGALNPQQFAAVTAGAGPVLVIAGAGTGKTRTLIYRVAYLVETGVQPEHIALLTFTRRAAREMLTRASALLDGRCSRVEGGTFHSYCVSILRRHAPRIGFPHQFNILDGSDAADVLDLLRARRKFHQAEKRFPKKRTLLSIFSAVWNKGMDLRSVLESEYPQFVDYFPQLQTLAHDYEAYKREHGLMDYDDLLRRTIDLFEQHDDVRRVVAGRCRHVLVDEYQDTNALQAELVSHLASVHGNVMAVGDDAQSIYGFRGADVRNIFDFPDRFQGARVLPIEHNYRSRQPVLDLANVVLRRARRRYDKTLVSDQKEGHLPALVATSDEQEEASFVAQMMLSLREEGVPLHEMAVLFRSSFNSYELEIELSRRDIPFVKYGGLKLAEAAHIKDVTSFLRIAENPLDTVAWHRMLTLHPGIGPRKADEVIEWNEQRVAGATDSTLPHASILADAVRLVEGLSGRPVPVADEIEQILGYYEPLLKDRYADDYQKRQQDLDHFAAVASSYTSRTEFLSALAIDPIDLTAVEVEASTRDERPVVLSTIHSAKGLEFDAVFVIQCLDGILPSSYSVRSSEALDEELRLLYVALTRARRELFISYPVLQRGRAGGDYFATISRFIADIPDAVLEPMQLVRESVPSEAEVPRLGSPTDGLPF
jgi:DNA helicase II / ATP-dependent DNA helicase PcrA